MLKNANPFSSYSVNDLDAAKHFYEDKLGIPARENEMGILELQLKNDHRVIMYPKPDHVAATFTVLNFDVPDVEATVDELTAKGITFEKYEDPIKTDSKGIMRGNGPVIAWFKDPAGNILSVVEQR